MSEGAPQTAEAPAAQGLALKLELLNSKMMERNFPGLKEQFDAAVSERARGLLTDGAFWAQVDGLLHRHGVTAEKLEKILEDRS